MKTAILSEAAPKPSGAYSQAVRVGDFIFTAGQLPLDPITGKINGTTIEEQTTRVLENLRAILKAGGSELRDVVKVTVHLRELSLFPRFNSVYESYFPDPKPARTTVGSQLGEGVMVEIDLVAFVGEAG